MTKIDRMTPEIEADIRARVNPVYVDWRGTESHERAMLLAEIDRLRHIFRVNMLRLAPETSHEEIDRVLKGAE